MIEFTPEDFDWVLPEVGSTSYRCKLADFVNHKLKGYRTLDNQLEQEKEKVECAHMTLDDHLVPRTENDKSYSLSGRINILAGKK